MIARNVYALVSFLLISAIVAGAVPAQADVTGSFSVHVTVLPESPSPQPGQTPSSEISPVEFDLQNEINVTLLISGLSTTLHSHFGIAGIEDVIFKSSVIFGAIELRSEIVFGRFDASGSLPDKPTPAFVKQRTKTILTLGGFTFRNLAIFEDTNFPQTPELAFGDLLTLSGQTPKGLAVTAQTGICIERQDNEIKKHSWPFRVDPACHGQPKPQLLFSFQRFSLSGLSLVPGIVGSTVVTCRIQHCELTNTLDIINLLIPLKTTFHFDNMFPMTFDKAKLAFTTGMASVTFHFNSAGMVTKTAFTLAPTINPSSNPATLEVKGTVKPGIGLTSGSIGATVQRNALSVEARANFSQGIPTTFNTAEFAATATITSFLELRSSATFAPNNLHQLETFLTFRF